MRFAPTSLGHKLRSVPTESTGVEGEPGVRVPPRPEDSHGDVSRRKRRRRTLHRVLFEVAVLSAAAVFVVLRAGDSLGNVPTTFRHLHWHWLLVAGAAEGGSIFCLSWLQQRLLREGGLGVGVADLLPVTMASNAVAQSLPAGTLFAEGYSFRQYQKLGAGWALGVWAELAAGALAATGLATVALVGAVVVGPSLRLELVPVLAFIWVGSALASALFARPGILGRLIARVLRHVQGRLPEKACTKMRGAERSLRDMECYQPSAGAWFRCFAVATCNWAFDSVVLVSALLTVGGPVPWSAVLLCYAAAQLLVELPITPGGLGVVEGGLTELLTRFHVGVTQATAGTLMYRAVSYWLLVLVGWVAAAWLAAHHRRANRRSQRVSAGEECAAGAVPAGASWPRRGVADGDGRGGFDQDSEASSAAPLAAPAGGVAGTAPATRATGGEGNEGLAPA